MKKKEMLSLLSKLNEAQLQVIIENSTDVLYPAPHPLDYQETAQFDYEEYCCLLSDPLIREP